jgi:serine protease AprX
VIIRTKTGRASAVADRVRGRNHSVLAQYAVIDAFVASVDANELAALDADVDVASMSIDAVVVSSVTKTSDGLTSDGAVLSTLGLPLTATGKGVGVAVIDSGIYFGSGEFAGARYFNFTSADTTPSDGYGHGTHVSGLIAGRGATSVKTPAGSLYQGVAPSAHIISLQALDAQGAGLTSSVIAALQFAVANKQALGIDIINLSLGHPIYEPAATDPLVQAVEAAVHAGIVVVAAAGNMGRRLDTGLPGYAGILSPGNAPSAITIGAINTQKTTTRLDDAVASYSSRGPTWFDGLAKPDLVAPGECLVSAAAPDSLLYTTLPDRRVTVNVNGTAPAKYFRLSGTSMATAVATGVAALAIEANRSAFATPLTPNLVKAILEFTALPVAGADALTAGRGEINAAGAVALALTLDPKAPIGPWWSGSPISPTTTIGGETWMWSQSIVWGNTVVWGMGDWGDTVVWGMGDGDTVVWGMTGDGDTVVWGMTGDGDTVVWGMTGDGDTVVWGMTDLVWTDPSFWNTAIVWGSGVAWNSPLPSSASAWSSSGKEQ